MDPYDWTRFAVTFFLRAPPDIAFRAWATAAGLESFLLEEAAFHRDGVSRETDDLAQAGDAYLWRWRHGLELAGDVVAVEPERRVVYTFGGMQVAVEVTAADADHARCVLRQTRIAETDEGRVMGHLNGRSCWVFSMANLKSVLEHGTDLRDPDPARVSSMEVGWKG